MKFNIKDINNYGSPYIIAEIGANHNGDMELAKKLIESASNSGAHSAKFQSWGTSSLISKTEYKRKEKFNDGDGGKKHFGSLKKMVEKYHIDSDKHSLLKAYCDEFNIDFSSTPFSISEVDLLVSLNVPFLKIASMDINNFRLLRYAARQDKPLILSTGMATLSEIKKAVNLIEEEGNNEIILLHCISIYPPEFSDINLNNIQMLMDNFKYPVGFSDHSVGIEIPMAAVALGACVIEKHFTLDKSLPGWDHAVSAEPNDLEMICKYADNISKSLGSYDRKLTEAELIKKKDFRRSIVCSRDLKQGTILTDQDIDFKRPGDGIPADQEDIVIGKKLTRSYKEDDLISFEDLI